MAPNRVAGAMSHSSSSSGIFFPGDGQSQVVGNSHLSSSFGNSSNSMPGTRNNFGPVSGDVSNTVLNSVASSGPSVGASSLVTDANSGLSGGGPHLQRSASINTESYMRLPASPMSFSSNNISISGSSIMDGSSGVQPSSNQDPNSQQTQQNQQHQGASSATSLPTSRVGQVQLPNGTRIPSSFIQDPSYLSQLQKKARLDVKQEEVLQPQVLQQMMQRQDSMHLQNPNPQLQALIQQQRLRQQQQQQQQLLQSMPALQRAHLLQQQQQQQQLQLRQQLHQPGMQPTSPMKRPYDGGVCSRRLMQYLYHQRQRPADNSIAYWRKFVAEYYAPRAKKRWCLSLYDNVGHHSLGVFPQASMDAWQCDICGSKSGRGFEATYDVLPRLNEIKFGSGVNDELLFLDLPRECRFPSGIMMLEYAKAVQESIYEQLRVVREGHLRIFFAPDLKILSWEFCARRHEELLPRRLVAPQVNQLLQVAQKCQSTISESGPDGVSQQDLQTNSNMVVTAGRQLARSLELQSLNDLGFSKRFVRCLQISEVVNSMTDLMDFCKEQKVGPIEGLKNVPRHVNTAKLQTPKMQETDQLGGMEGLPTDRSAINKLMALHPGLGNQMGNNQQMAGRGALSGSAQAALALTNYQNLLMRQNSMNSSRSSLQQEASSSFNNSNQTSSSTLQGAAGMVPGSLQNSSVGGLSGSHVQQPQPMQQRLLNGNALLQQSNPQPSQSSQALQQHMIQQLMHDMANNSSRGSGAQPSISGQSINGGVSRDGLGFNNTSAGSTSAANGPGNVVGPAPSRSNSFKAASNSESSAAGGNSGFNQKAAELPQSLRMPDEMVPDITDEFTESGFLNGDLDDSMNFGWEAVMDWCQNQVSVAANLHSNCSKLELPEFGSNHASLDDLFASHGSEGDMALEWLSTFVEDCLTSTGNCLPPTQMHPKDAKTNFSAKANDKGSEEFMHSEKVKKTSSFLHSIVIPGKARSKRKRASVLRARNPFSCWSYQDQSFQLLINPDPPLLQQAYWLADSELINPGKDDEQVKTTKKREQMVEEAAAADQAAPLALKEVVDTSKGQQQPRRCSHCLAQKTPQWRAGPLGPKTLCNACGVRYKSGRLLPEYRPAKSPTFVSYKHSNSHKRVMEMRMALLQSNS